MRPRSWRRPASLYSSSLCPNVIATIWVCRARLFAPPTRRPRSATAVPGSARSNGSIRQRPPLSPRGSGRLAPSRWLLLAAMGGRVALPAAGGAMVAAHRLVRTPASAVFAVSNVDTSRWAVWLACTRQRCATTSSGAGWPFGMAFALCALPRRTRLRNALWARSRLSSLPRGLRLLPRTTAAASLLTTTFRGLARLGLLLSTSCLHPWF